MSHLNNSLLRSKSKTTARRLCFWLFHTSTVTREFVHILIFRGAGICKEIWATQETTVSVSKPVLRACAIDYHLILYSADTRVHVYDDDISIPSGTCSSSSWCTRA
jgi:hypothetical protein